MTTDEVGASTPPVALPLPALPMLLLRGGASY